MIAYLAIEPDDPRYQNDEQWGLSAVQAPSAWNITKGLSSVKIAIHDYFPNSGHRDTVTDLSSKLTGGQQIWGDHGTLVSSVAGAVTDNGYGMASLGWMPEIWPYYYLEFDESIADAVADGADVINFSWIGGDIDDVEAEIINALLAGVVCVAATGNTQGPPPTVFYPAAYAWGPDTGQVIAVTGTRLDGNEEFRDGWNYSVDDDPVANPIQSFTDLAAPGVDILMAQDNGGFSTAEGTSLSSPMVSALAALILSVNSSLTPQQVYDILIATTDKVDASSIPYNITGRNGQSWNTKMGYGRVNAYKALKYTLENYGGTVQDFTITAGESWSFAANVQIIVNGTFTAVGTSGSPITLTKSGGSNWGGIVVNSGGSANIQYANISYAGTGVHLNGVSGTQTIKYCNFTNITNYGIQITNSNSAANDISYNTISGPSYCIYLNSSSAVIHQNTLSSAYSGSGIYSYGGGGSGWITNNIISAYEAVWADNYSTLYMLKPSPSASGHNETLVGSVTLLADNNSTIEAGGYSSIQGKNSFYGGGIDAQAIALNSSTITAQYNWWNSDFSNIESGGGSVDMSNPLGSDPNGGWSGKLAAPIAANPSSMDNVTVQARFVTTDSPMFDEALKAARNSMAQGNYDEAIRLFSEKVKSNDDLKRKKYALAQLAECYRRVGRSGFIDFLKNEIRPTLAKSDELYVSSLELEGNVLTGAQRYAAAATVYESVRSDYSGRPETYKHALFNLANLYQSQLGMGEKAKECVEQLKTNYPQDELTRHAQILMGEENPTVSEGRIASEEQGERTQKPDVALENYPNPFNPSTQIRYFVPTDGLVNLKVFDLLGREVVVLVNEFRKAGAHHVTFDASNLPSGIYFYRLQAKEVSAIQKMMLVR